MSEVAQAWAVTQNTTSIAVLEEFVRQFENTPYGPLARARLEELKRNQSASIPPIAPQTSGSQPAPQQSAVKQTSAARQECEQFTKFSSEQLGRGGDATNAIAACRRALDLLPNDQHLIFRLALAYHVNRNFNDALRLYRQAAEMGDSYALNRLGEIYRNGRIVPQDFREAARFFRRAADLGNASAMNNLARISHQKSASRRRISD